MGELPVITAIGDIFCKMLSATFNVLIGNFVSCFRFIVLIMIPL